MVKTPYVPERTDIIWLNFDPKSGHEQGGKRPALVLTPSSYNAKTGLLIACPITSRIKGYPFEVEVKTETISGVVLADQIKCLDWKSRQATFICKFDAVGYKEIKEKLGLLIL